MKLTLPILCITFVTFREENRLSLFEYMFLRKKFGLKRKDVKGDWRKFHKAERRDFSPNNVREIKSKRLRGAVCWKYGE
jgi:hypothetical protein